MIPTLDPTADPADGLSAWFPGGLPEAAQAIEQEWLRRQADLASRNFAAFVRFVWPVIKQGVPLVWSWYHDLICREVEILLRGGYWGVPWPDKPPANHPWPRYTDGKQFGPGGSKRVWVPVNRLGISAPPRSTKSTIISACLQPFIWLQRPSFQMLNVSAGEDLAVRDTMDSRRIMRSDRYLLCKQCAHERGMPWWEFAEDKNSAQWYINTRSGHRQAVAFGANIVGKGADGLVLDDVIDVKQAIRGSSDTIEANMGQAQRIIDGSIMTRMNNPIKSWALYQMQRIHPRDPMGCFADLALRGMEGFRLLVLPLEYDPDHPHIHPDDRRTKRGELLDDRRWPASFVAERKADPTKAIQFQAQYNQSPAEAAGTMFRREWLRYYVPHDDGYRLDDNTLIKASDCWRVLSVDPAASDREHADPSALVVLDIHKGRRDQAGQPLKFVVHLERDRLDAPSLFERIKNLQVRFRPRTSLIEWSSNGIAVEQFARREGVRLEAVKVAGKGSKTLRAWPLQSEMQNARVWFPREAAWLTGLEDELLAFPGGQHDDQVDALANAVNWSEEFDRWEPEKKAYPPGTFGALYADTLEPKQPKLMAFNV